MRITQAFIRNARIRITQSVNDIFKLTDDRLLAYVQAGMPGIKIEPSTTREELLRMAVHWAVDQAIPDRYIT